MRQGQGNLDYASMTLPPIALDVDLSCEAPVVAEGLAYWQKKAAGRAFPLRSDIRPEEIVRILPNLCLFELRRKGGELEMFPRLAGSRFEEVFGRLHNKPLGAMLPPEIIERWHGAARTLLEVGAPLRATGRVLFQEKTFIRFEMVIAPLSTNGTGIDMMYLVIDFTMDDNGA